MQELIIEAGDSIIVRREPAKALTAVDHLEAALAQMRNGAAPAPAVSYSPLLQPELIKLAPNGKRLPTMSSDEHHGVLIPGVLRGQDLIIDARKPSQADNWNQACELGAKIDLFGAKAQLWLPEEAQLIIRRDLRDPACDKNFFPHMPTSDIVWTRRALEPASSSGVAWGVYFERGYVYWGHRAGSGFVVASRLVPAGQF